MSTTPSMSGQIAGYARVSTTEQANDSNALNQQQARLRAAGATTIYTDVEYDGATA